MENQKLANYLKIALKQRERFLGNLILTYGNHSAAAKEGREEIATLKRFIEELETTLTGSGPKTEDRP